MASNREKKKRGFTPPEKWIIWGVFCLLIGLSTYRFAVFFGLMLLSLGVSLIHKKQNLALGLALSLIGALSVVFGKYLV